jgi:hypothetical protein
MGGPGTGGCDLMLTNGRTGTDVRFYQTLQAGAWTIG